VTRQAAGHAVLHPSNLLLVKLTIDQHVFGKRYQYPRKALAMSVPVFDYLKESEVDGNKP
jgi:hypothetical protein